MTARRRQGWLGAGLLLVLLPSSAGVGHAQVQDEGQPERVPVRIGDPEPRDFPLAGLQRVELDHGGEAWILPDPGTPLVAVALVLPATGAGGAGGLASPGGLRVPLGWPGECPGPGPRAVLRPDHLVVSLLLLSGELRQGLGCLATALPEWPGPAAAPIPDPATSLLLEELHGAEHPYARAVPGSLVVVVGGVDPGEAASLLRSTFSLEPAGGPAEAATARAVPPAALEVVLLDRPGAPGVELRVGQLLMEGDHPDWTALTVAAAMLNPPEAAGGAPGAGPALAAGLLRNRGQGALVAGAAVPVGEAEATLTRFFRRLDALRDRLAPEEVLDAVTTALSGAFLRSTETPEQVAAQLARVGALGLEPASLGEYRSRLASLDPEALRLAVRRRLDPERMVVVAVGDADLLEEHLRSLGPVRRVEQGALTAGDAVEPEDVPVEEASDGAAPDGTALEPGRRVYRILLRGVPAGEVRRTLEQTGDSLRFVSVAELPGQRIEQVVVARRGDLTFLSGTTRVTGVEGDALGSLRLEEGVLRGSLPGGERGGVALPVPREVVVGDLLELVVASAPLAVGSAFLLPVADAVAGRVVPTRVEVAEATRVTVPAGTFPVFRVEVSGAERQTLWVLRERPHRVVRLEAGSGGLVMELLRGEEGGGGPG